MIGLIMEKVSNMRKVQDMLRVLQWLSKPLERTPIQSQFRLQRRIEMGNWPGVPFLHSPIRFRLRGPTSRREPQITRQSNLPSFRAYQKLAFFFLGGQHRQHVKQQDGVILVSSILPFRLKIQTKTKVLIIQVKLSIVQE